MILVFASELNDNARSAVANWPDQGAILLTPADFFCRGWVATTGGIDDWSVVAAGERHPAGAVSGVVTLLSRIMPRELFDVQPEERHYAAAEASAFALFLLSKLPCNVVNRPTPDCLSGPNWRPEQWLQACFKAGLQTEEGKRTNQTFPSEVRTPDLLTVTVLGGKCIEDNSGGSLSNILELARLAGVVFLRVYFKQTEGHNIFRSAELMPDLSDAKICKALHEYFADSSLS